MHTDHSPDCATPVEVLLAHAREQGLGAIAITDHNEISGALEAAREGRGDQGDRRRGGQDRRRRARSSACSCSERIPRGMSLAETVAEIRRQGGLVYVPHPFDRMHAVPGYEHLLSILDEIDAFEIFNAARRDRVVQRGGRALRRQVPPDRRRRVRLRTSPRASARCACGCATSTARSEFLESLRDAEILTRPTSLLYVQALKFLETRATPQGARRARRARRVRRAMRKS